jgi:hypothetical protein
MRHAQQIAALPCYGQDDNQPMEGTRRREDHAPGLATRNQVSVEVSEWTVLSPIYGGKVSK